MIKSKICGVSDTKILKFIVNHPSPPQFVGFICNYPRSKRFVKLNKLKKLTQINKKKINFVSVLVRPKETFLEKIKDLNFDYYQLYDVSASKTKKIKEKYNKKIITAITIEDSFDVNKYKEYISISDIILFDGKGYEKSIGFDHELLKKIPNSITKMIAGNIQYKEKFDKYFKIANIIDISGGLETSGKKDISKIDFFLKKINVMNNENKKENTIN